LVNRINLNKVDGFEEYQYEDMLNRISEIIKAKKGEVYGSAGTFRLAEPMCTKGRTKTTWNNCDQVCKDLNRDP
jgi:translation initiation factor 2 beta subunit (eIF-2beta)/eIF-5